jgi:hypothetical protein
MGMIMHDINAGVGDRRAGKPWAGIIFLLLLFGTFFAFHAARPELPPDIGASSIEGRAPSELPVLNPYSGTKLVSRPQSGPGIPEPDDGPSHSVNAPSGGRDIPVIGNSRAAYAPVGSAFISCARACGRYPRAPPALPA